jgi:putative transposase
LDAKVEKVRAGGRVEHRALVVADGVDASGRREVIGLDVGVAETEAFWREFRCSLVGRGLRGVQLVLSDAHEGSDRRSPRSSALHGSVAPSISWAMPWPLPQGPATAGRRRDLAQLRRRQP